MKVTVDGKTWDVIEEYAMTPREVALCRALRDLHGIAVAYRDLLETDCLNAQAFEAVKARHRALVQLPQFREGEGIDITGGQDSAEYVRELRDGD